MIILFPAYPTSIREVDPSFANEAAAAKEAGFKIGYVDLEIMFGGEIKLKLPQSDDKEVIYRGWILKMDIYQKLYDELQSRGLRLVNTPKQHKFANHIPEWYPVLSEMTPLSVWKDGAIDSFKESDINEMVKNFGDSPIMVKDFMKSRKQDWFEACFIPNAYDLPHVNKVTNKFLELQGEAFEGGLVFRKFIELQQLGIHSKSRMPLVNEWRYFVYNNYIVDVIPYWEDAKYESEPPVRLFPKMDVEFYTVDVAQTVAGEWIVVDMGDASCSGIPPQRDSDDFYHDLKMILDL